MRGILLVWDACSSIRFGLRAIFLSNRGERDDLRNGVIFDRASLGD
jgi:hypothetical protein